MATAGARFRYARVPEQRSKQRTDGAPAVDEEIEREDQEDEGGRELDERGRVDELDRDQSCHEGRVDALGPERDERSCGEECQRDREARLELLVGVERQRRAFAFLRSVAEAT